MSKCQVETCQKKGMAKASLPVGDTGVVVTDVWLCHDHIKAFVCGKREFFR